MHKLGKAEISTHYTPTLDWNTVPARKYCYAANPTRNARQKMLVSGNISKKALLPGWWSPGVAAALRLLLNTWTKSSKHSRYFLCKPRPRKLCRVVFSFPSLKITSLFLFFMLNSWEFYTWSTNFTYRLKYNLLTSLGMPSQSTQEFSQLSLGWIFFSPWCSACNGKYKSFASHIWNASLNSLHFFKISLSTKKESSKSTTKPMFF